MIKIKELDIDSFLKRIIIIHPKLFKGIHPLISYLLINRRIGIYNKNFPRAHPRKIDNTEDLHSY